jgi:hypothetical protein
LRKIHPDGLAGLVDHPGEKGIILAELVVFQNGLIERIHPAIEVLGAQALQLDRDLIAVISRQSGGQEKIGDHHQGKKAEQHQQRIAGGDAQADGAIDFFPPEP